MRLTLRVFSLQLLLRQLVSEQHEHRDSRLGACRSQAPAPTTPAPPNGSTPGVTQVVPNWNDPAYLVAFGQLLAALGRRYDGDERLSVFEFSGYGDFSENHIAYLRDTLGAPGAAPDESVAMLGVLQPVPRSEHHQASIQQLVAANVNAFPHTQLVVNPQNPEIVRELLADDVTKKLVRAGGHPLGLPRCPGAVAGVGRVQRTLSTCSPTMRSSTRSSSGWPRRW